MAIVNVSRIQLRRGRKNEGVGIPQLSTGEMAWSIDTRELYIGNGSVQEGAPFIGNTKILTETDNLLELITSYQYKTADTTIQTGDSPNTPIARSIQDRLDDFVNVRNFGVTMDGVTDDSDAFQRSIDQLFLNTLTKSSPVNRVVIYIPAGTMFLSKTIYLPPYVSLSGAGEDKTVIRSAATGSAFVTVNLDSEPGTPALDSTTTALNQSKFINISSMTIDVITNGAALDLRNCAFGNFYNIKLTGTWQNLDPVVLTNKAIILSSLSNIVGCFGNIFTNVTIQGFAFSVYSDFDTEDNTWELCSFSNSHVGVAFGLATNGTSPGQLTGPVRNIIKNCVFNDIDRQGIQVVNGEYNTSTHNKFYMVGNNGGTSETATYAVVDFTGTKYNKSINDWFERTNDLSTSSEFANIPYVSEVVGQSNTDYLFENSVTITELQSPTPVFKLPGDEQKIYKIQYVYGSSVFSAKRVGTLTIYADRASEEYSLTDSYEFFGDDQYEEAITFTLSDIAQVIHNTLLVSITNVTVGDSGTLTYKVTDIGSQ